MVLISAGTPVIEVCFDNSNALFPQLPAGMDCPEMYALEGINLGLPYWVVTATGVHSSPMKVRGRTSFRTAPIGYTACY